MRRFIVALGMALAVSGMAEATIAITDGMRLKDPEGKTMAVVVTCSDKGAQGKGAALAGSEEGFVGSDRCGKCLIDANWGALIQHPYDLVLKGTLLDEDDKPVESQLLHFFLPNGWTVKTRTAASGYFRILMGATAERKSETPLVIDIGTFHMKREPKRPFYAFYLLPEHFRPCEAKK